MATSEFLVIASCANAVEAEQIRSLLQENGVPAFVDGANSNTAMSQVGTALGGVRVLVRTSDAERTAEILESVRGQSDVSADPWFCGQCQEEIEGAFEVCWSCGQARGDVERPFPVPGSDAHFQSGVGWGESADVPLPDHFGYDDSNPYASPLTPAATAAPTDGHLQFNDEVEAMLVRAWRASIIGIVLFPFLTQLYSMYLLIRAAATTATFSPDGEKRFFRALAVNVVVGSLWGMTIWFLLGL